MKVLDGYLHHGELRELLSALGRFVTYARAACEVAVAEQYAAAGCDVLDRLALDLRQEYDLVPHLQSGASALSAFRRVADESRKETLAKGRRDTDHDWQCRVLIYPANQGPTPLRLLAERRDIYRPTFEAISGIKDFHYDGRHDGGPHLPEAEWVARRDLWDKISKGDFLTGAPMALEAVPEEGYRPEIVDVVARQPTLQVRAHRLAMRIEMDAFMADRRGEAGDLDPNALMQWAWATHLAFQRWAREAAGKAKIQARAADVEGRLPASYTVDDLRRRIHLPPAAEAEASSPAP